MWLSRVFSLVCLAAWCVYVPMVTAQEPGHDLDDLAKRVSKQISKAGISAVVVADFVNLDGTTSMQGQYLAEEFSQRLEHHKKNFALVDRKKLSSALSN